MPHKTDLYLQSILNYFWKDLDKITDKEGDLKEIRSKEKEKSLVIQINK
jgi:hypothetical protein